MAGGTAVLRGMARVLPSRAIRPFGRPVAFHFHGVEQQIDDPRIQRNHHRLDAFYRIAKALKSEFEVLPLSALADVLKAPQRHAHSAFLMSDDGYRNALTNTADVLDGLGLPWTLFVSTHHIDTGEFNPMTAARLFFYFAQSGRYPIAHLGAPIELGAPETRDAAALRGIKRLRALDAVRGREAIAAMLRALPSQRLADLKGRYSSERFLNWPQVAELAKCGVEIGAHAHWHWPMRGAAVDLTREARTSKERIENQIGACRAFAYPFGNTADISRDAWRAVRDAGYAYAFTTLAGSLDGGANPWLLPRYELQGEEANMASLAPLLRLGNRRLTRWQRRLA